MSNAIDAELFIELVTLPMPSKSTTRLVVGYLSLASTGQIVEHRVFVGDPRPTCKLCGTCQVHKEADGRYYCDRDTGLTSAVPTLPLGRCGV